MSSKLGFLAYAIAAYVVFKFLNFVRLAFDRRRRAQELGAEKAPRVGHVLDYLGIEAIRDLLRADKKKRFPTHYEDRFQVVSQKEGRYVSTIVYKLAGTDHIVTSEPANIQAILAIQFKDFYHGPDRCGNLKELLGKGIITTDGKEWEHNRAMLRPQFIRSQISDLDLEENHVQNLMKALPVDHSAWTAETDLLPLFHRLTLDTSTEFLFGESLEAQLSALPGRNHKATSYGRGEVAFAHHWESALRALSRGTRLGTQWKWAHNTAFREDRRKIHAFVDHFVQRALSLPQEEIEKGSEPKNGKYIFLYAIAAQTRDPSALRSAALNILIAGRDTTAQLLSWIFLLLAAHPRVFQQLRSRILKEFGTYDAPRNLDFASLKNCRYLQWTMNETLRLFPLVPVNNREAQRDTTLPVGGGPDGTRPVFVGKGEVVEFSLTTMHRRKDFWGPDANEFRPERWEARKMGWNYLPFNGGPRTCLGQQFALTEAGYVVVRLLQRFGELEGHGAWMADQVGDAQEDVGRIEGMGLVRHGLALSDAPGDGVRLRMKEMRG